MYRIVNRGELSHDATVYLWEHGGGYYWTASEERATLYPDWIYAVRAGSQAIEFWVLRGYDGIEIDVERVAVAM